MLRGKDVTEPLTVRQKKLSLPSPIHASTFSHFSPRIYTLFLRSFSLSLSLSLPTHAHTHTHTHTHTTHTPFVCAILTENDLSRFILQHADSFNICTIMEAGGVFGWRRKFMLFGIAINLHSLAETKPTTQCGV